MRESEMQVETDYLCLTEDIFSVVLSLPIAFTSMYSKSLLLQSLGYAIVSHSL